MGALSKLAVRQAIKAYHGSPHIFDRFKMSAVGRGEGAQAYGHGLYFAENPETAAAYRNALEHLGPTAGPGKLARDVMDIFGGDRDKAMRELQSRSDAWRATPVQYRVPGGEKLFGNAIDAIAEGTEGFGGGGRFYKVDINADPESFLNWSKPISREHPLAEPVDKLYQDAMRRRDYTVRSPVDKQFSVQRLYEDLVDAMPTFNHPEASRQASNKLRDIGVPGIKYLDQYSRAAGEGTNNFSVFDDSLIKIKDRYAHGGLAVRRGKR